MGGPYLRPKETQFAQINSDGLETIVGADSADCSGVLTLWLLQLHKPGVAIEFHYSDFQHWVEDRTSRKPYADITIRRAIFKLIKHGCVELIKRYRGGTWKVRVFPDRFPQTEKRKAVTAINPIPLPSDPSRQPIERPCKKMVETIADDQNRSRTIKTEGSNADSLVVTTQRSSNNQTEDFVLDEQGGIGTQVESLFQETQESLTSSQCGEVDEQTKEALIREVREVCPLNPTLLQMVLQTIEKYGSRAVRILQGTVQAVQEQIDRGNCENSVKMLSGALKSALNGRAWTPNSWKKKDAGAVPKEVPDQPQVSQGSATVTVAATLEQQQQPGSNGSLREVCTRQAITGYPDGTLCYKDRDEDGWYLAVPELPEEDREWVAIAARLKLSTGRWDWVESLKEFEIEVRDGIWEPLAVLRRTFSLTELRESL